MSYEGYEQFLCENGHFWTVDCYDSRTKCPDCKGKAVWFNGVDLTNGSWDDNGRRIDGYVKLEIDVPAEECTCEKCGHKHNKTVATYKIPKNKGHRIREDQR